MKRTKLTEDLVCNGLGYCCPFAFFNRYNDTGLIAARLGVHPATARKHVALFKQQVYSCEAQTKCLEHRIAQATKSPPKGA